MSNEKYLYFNLTEKAEADIYASFFITTHTQTNKQYDLTQAPAVLFAVLSRKLVCFLSSGCQMPEKNTPTVQKSSPSALSGPNRHRPCKKVVPCPEPPGHTGSGDERMQRNHQLNLRGLPWSPR